MRKTINTRSRVKYKNLETRVNTLGKLCSSYNKRKDGNYVCSIKELCSKYQLTEFELREKAIKNNWGLRKSKITQQEKFEILALYHALNKNGKRKFSDSELQKKFARSSSIISSVLLEFENNGYKIEWRKNGRKINNDISSSEITKDNEEEITKIVMGIQYETFDDSIPTKLIPLQEILFHQEKAERVGQKRMFGITNVPTTVKNTYSATVASPSLRSYKSFFTLTLALATIGIFAYYGLKNANIPTRLFNMFDIGKNSFTENKNRDSPINFISITEEGTGGEDDQNQEEFIPVTGEGGKKIALYKPSKLLYPKKEFNKGNNRGLQEDFYKPLDNLVSSMIRSAEDNLENEEKFRITSRYGKRNGKFHKGWDIIGEKLIYPIKSGEVVYAKWNGGLGNTIVVEHFDDYETWYCHLSYINAAKGSYVTPNTMIGIMGNTGKAHGAHLHFEVRKDELRGRKDGRGNAIDPALYLKMLLKDQKNTEET